MQIIDPLKKSEIMNFVGEVFYHEMTALLNISKNKQIWIKPKGVNSRAFSKDIVDITSYSYVVNNDIKEAIFIHISRNSIYHQLPESLFHPLVLSDSSMNKKEVIEAMKENRKIQEENINFFIPFDTLLFEKRVRLTERYIDIFTNPTSKKTLFNLAQKVINKDIPITQEQYYKLLLNLCQSENFKENLPELEKLLQRIMGYKVNLEYKKHIHLQSPFKPVGAGILGFTFGTQGKTICEFEDVEATMIYEDEVNYKNIKKDMKIITNILEYFIFSNRNINVKFQTKMEVNVILGQNYLGFNTILMAS